MDARRREHQGQHERFLQLAAYAEPPLITLVGDTAQARTDFLATHQGRADQGWNVHYNACGAFHDDLVRTGWRIQFRRLEVYFGDPLQIAETA